MNSHLYAGIDVGKNTFHVAFCYQRFVLPNTPCGVAELCRRVSPATLVCEASGGYERTLRRATLPLAIEPISVFAAGRRKWLLFANRTAAYMEVCEEPLLSRGQAPAQKTAICSQPQ